MNFFFYAGMISLEPTDTGTFMLPTKVEAAIATIPVATESLHRAPQSPGNLNFMIINSNYVQ